MPKNNPFGYNIPFDPSSGVKGKDAPKTKKKGKKTSKKSKGGKRGK